MRKFAIWTISNPFLTFLLVCVIGILMMIVTQLAQRKFTEKLATEKTVIIQTTNDTIYLIVK